MRIGRLQTGRPRSQCGCGVSGMPRHDAVSTRLMALQLKSGTHCAPYACLKVRGLNGLRVIDASVMPKMVSGNIQAAMMMVKEGGADFVLADRKL